MNVNNSITAATLDELTADTNITIELRTCLLMVRKAEIKAIRTTECLRKSLCAKRPSTAILSQANFYPASSNTLTWSSYSLLLCGSIHH